MTTMSPVEQAVLASCEQDRTISEVQLDLEPEFTPEQVAGAFAWLRRKRLLELDTDASSLDPHRLFRQSQMGALFLRRQRTRQAAQETTPGGLRLVVG
jgi:hypothetical protein